MADLDHLHPVLRARVRHALSENRGAYVLSGARSNARQWELWWAHERDPANNAPANYPGTSWHEYDEKAPWPNVGAREADATALAGGCWAMAVDLAGSYGGIARNAARYGLVFPIQGEAWHAQPGEIPEKRRTPGAWRRLPVPGPPPPPPDPLDLQGRTALVFIGE